MPSCAWISLVLLRLSLLTSKLAWAHWDPYVYRSVTSSSERLTRVDGRSSAALAAHDHVKNKANYLQRALVVV